MVIGRNNFFLKSDIKSSMIIFFLFEHNGTLRFRILNAAISMEHRYKWFYKKFLISHKITRLIIAIDGELIFSNIKNIGINLFNGH